MTVEYRRLALTLLLVVAAAIGGAWMGGRIFTQPPPSHADFHNQLYSVLNLSEEQRENLDALEQRNKKEEAFQREALRIANRNLANLLEHEDSYNDNVEAAIVDIHTAMNGLQVLTIKHLYDMREILDPEQRTEFDRLVADTLREHAK
ncbi:MAG: periplasmic heavy metal sensor [Alphaproteobacteria bacterium]|nr:periplasmic heavy metal sensor [Alphaproteobacteria bacterium]